LNRRVGKRKRGMRMAEVEDLLFTIVLINVYLRSAPKCLLGKRKARHPKQARETGTSHGRPQNEEDIRQLYRGQRGHQRGSDA